MAACPKPAADSVAPPPGRRARAKQVREATTRLSSLRLVRGKLGDQVSKVKIGGPEYDKTVV